MADKIRAGMIGLDTSHCRVFTEMFNQKLPDLGVQMVAAYPSFSPDLQSSASRIEEYKKLLSGTHGLKITASIEELVGRVDAILIESVDGRRHLKELQAVAGSGKPVYIDKPFAAGLADAKEMVYLIQHHKLPCFSASSLRFDSTFQQFVAEKDAKYGKVLGCDAFSPAHLEKTNPGLFWYGIHGAEILYTIMGRGCQTVSCTKTPDGELAVGIWSEGRLGSLRGIRGKAHGDYGATILSEKAPVTMLRAKGDFYEGLARALAKFFKTREAPVPIEDTLEICAFIDAALKSTDQSCDDIKLDLK